MVFSRAACKKSMIKRDSPISVDCPAVRYFMERFFFLPITVVPDRHHRINAQFLFIKKSLLLLFVDSTL